MNETKNRMFLSRKQTQDTLSKKKLRRSRRRRRRVNFQNMNESSTIKVVADDPNAYIPPSNDSSNIARVGYDETSVVVFDNHQQRGRAIG
jgi:hypothetical protein